MKAVRGIVIVLISIFGIQAVVWILIMIGAICSDTGWKDVSNDHSFGNFAPVIGTWKSKLPLRIEKIAGKLY